MVAFTYSGIAMGAALGGPLSAFLVEQIGWRSLFYIEGSIAIFWSILWFFLVDESPTTHPRISEKEKQYILTSIGQQHAGRKLSIPWCSIIR